MATKKQLKEAREKKLKESFASKRKSLREERDAQGHGYDEAFDDEHKAVMARLRKAGKA